MQRYLWFILAILLTCSSLTGCASNRNPGIRADLSREAWMGKIDTSPNAWGYGASSWFMRGDATPIELANREAPYSQAISTMMVRVPNFSSIQVQGDFRVQIFGTPGHNSVYLNGPNAAVRNIAVSVRGNTLCLSQAKNAPYAMRHVIVRIGMSNLNCLTLLNGCASIEGVRINSNGLYILTSPMSSGSIYLAGQMNLRRVVHNGTCRVSIFGAYSPYVDIRTNGGGSVNISGRVGLRTITHHGTASINILGAMPNCGTKIFADGKGKIGISGCINLKEIRASDNTCIYISGVSSSFIYAYLHKHARIGLAGRTRDLYVDAYDSTRFAGRNLCSQNAYVRAFDGAHINVTATNKIFASSTGYSSVYFYGSPELMSQFVNGSGVVIPVWHGGYPSCYAARPVDYKGERV